MVHLLAIWLVKAVFLPLDPACPEHRLRSILKEACPCVVIGWDELFSTDCADFSLRDSVPEYCDENPPAYLIYTSGSTGKPKGELLQRTRV